ncbi:MAG: hypothetical protein H8D23_34140 [Candidatus Brocadiales bacterium]|nr:hypothetical protein [Candidatus Brocadiales bacterium]
MSTTVLFIEHLITGFQASIWIVLFILTIFGYEWINLFDLEKYATVITLLFISFVYPLGVFIDNIADDLLKPWNRMIRSKYIQDENQSARSLLAMTKDEVMAEYLGYVRTRIRISRSAFVNFLLISIMICIFTATKLRDALGIMYWRVLVIELIIGIILTGLALLAWFRISHTFAMQISRGFDNIS